MTIFTEQEAMNASVALRQLMNQPKLHAETMNVIEDRIEEIGEVLEA